MRLILLFAVALLGLISQPANAATGEKSFKLYSTLFPNNPDLSKYGIPSLTMVSPIGYVDGKPDLELARKFARQAAGILINDRLNTPIRDAKGRLQLVHPTQGLVVDQEGEMDLQTPKGRQDMLAVVRAIRQEWASYPDHPEFKDLKLGVFGPAPPGAPLESTLDDPGVLDKWDAQTDACAPLIDALDFVAPVLYSDTIDQSQFGARMSLQIRNARRLNKPVYPFIWPEYFEFAAHIPRHELIGGDQWQAILDECRNEADGAILWGGEHKFDPALPWARITQNYLATQPLPAPDPPANLTVDPVGLHLKWDAVAPSSRVRIERSIDAGAHWRPIGETSPGETKFDDPLYWVTPSGFAPQYRIQACNAFSSSPYVSAAVIHPSRDAFAINQVVWNDAAAPQISRDGMLFNNLHSGQWIEFQNVAFRRNADHATLQWRSTAALDIWLDCNINPDHTLDFTHATKAASILGRRVIESNADSPVAILQQSAPLTIAGGPNTTHNIFLVSPDRNLDLQWIQFGGPGDPPAPPRLLAASGHGGKVLLTWIDASDDETGFAVERSLDKGTTWTRLPDAPPHHPADPVSDQIVSYFDLAPNPMLNTYRVSALHGQGLAQDPIPDVAYGASNLRPVGVKFNAINYEREIGVVQDEKHPDRLCHTQYVQPSTPPMAKDKKYGWVKYSAVDFGTDSNRITLHLAPEQAFLPTQTLTFYLDRLADKNKLSSFTPNWTGGGGYYEDQTFPIPKTSGVHDLYMQLDDLAYFNATTLCINKVSPVPDINPASTRATSDHIHLVWEDNSDQVNGYIVQWRKVLTKPNPTPQDFIPWISRPISFRQHADDIPGLDPNTDYEFCVIARTTAGGLPSVRQKFTTSP
ncbi:MAG TPA: carbohydrate-binding protein [Tepidisphaeraceae bacterium]|nr:carbohydrate-binding protein [Tepidisphaeraceae bacterium]